VKLEADLAHELDYLAKEEAANKALNQIRLMLMNAGQFDYKKIPELNTLMSAVREGHNRLLDAKREELNEIVRQCLAAIHTAGSDSVDTKTIITTADTFYTQQKQKIQTLTSSRSSTADPNDPVQGYHGGEDRGHDEAQAACEAGQSRDSAAAAEKETHQSLQPSGRLPREAA
jgi:hypothetical protein